MGNNNKVTERDVRMVWVQKQVIMCRFVSQLEHKSVAEALKDKH